jgi:hypothetical protein
MTKADELLIESTIEIIYLIIKDDTDEQLEAMEEKWATSDKPSAYIVRAALARIKDSGK